MRDRCKYLNVSNSKLHTLYSVLTFSKRFTFLHAECIIRAFLQRTRQVNIVYMLSDFYLSLNLQVVVSVLQDS